jgi:hypothetical protein
MKGTIEIIVYLYVICVKYKNISKSFAKYNKILSRRIVFIGIIMNHIYWKTAEISKFFKGSKDM